MSEERRRILVVEDNVAMLGVIRFKLERAGLRVVCAHCGQTAWELLSQHDFDLVVADFQMPGMTGGELCRRKRQDARLAETPLILLTAKGFELDLDHYRNVQSVSAVIFKPFSPQELVHTVNRCLAVAAAGA